MNDFRDMMPTSEEVYGELGPRIMQMNEIVRYQDIILMVYEGVKDVCDDNGCSFDMNLSLYLEGLEEDVRELENGRELRHIPVRPKEQQDVDL